MFIVCVHELPPSVDVNMMPKDVIVHSNSMLPGQLIPLVGGAQTAFTAYLQRLVNRALEVVSSDYIKLVFHGK